METCARPGTIHAHSDNLSIRIIEPAIRAGTSALSSCLVPSTDLFEGYFSDMGSIYRTILFDRSVSY